jgi:hypothetical protein
VIALLLALSLAGPTEAVEPRREVETGSRLAKRVDRDLRETHEVRMIQAQYGECVVKKQYEGARDFVLTPDLEGGDWRRAVRKVSDGHCLMVAATAANGVEMTFPSDMMRYTLAEALIRRDFASGAPPSLKNAGPIVQPTLDESKYVPKPGRKARKADLEEMAEQRSKQLALVYLAQYGECVVRAETSSSYALLKTQPDSLEESAAFASLKPVLGECMPAGQTLAFSKTTLRGTIAMNLYRLAHAPRVAGQVTGATK